MNYPFALRLVLVLIAFALIPLGAGAQTSGAGLDSFSLGGPPPVNKSPRSLDKIVAVVNDDVILKSELDATVAQLKKHRGSQLGQLPPNELRSQVLDQLIMRKLLDQEADREGIKVSKAQLQQGLARIAQNNHMNLDQFRKAVAASGMNMDELRQRVRDQMRIALVRKKNVMQQVSVSDADVERYLDNQSRRFARGHQYHLRQIRLDLPGQANATVTGVARDRLLQLRKKIIQGKLSFADAAHSVSEGAHAAAGGDLGWVSGAQLPDRFDSALAGLSSGQISPVFQGPKGLYLIKLEGERGGQKDPDHQHQVMVTEVHLRHLILKPNEIRNDARTRELVENLYKRLQAGGDFASLARQYSDDKATAQQGGDVGWIALKRIPSQTRQRIEGLHKGDISRILKTGDGYEIIKLLDRRHSDKTEQARRNKARQALGQKRAREKGKLWLHQLRDEAYIDIRMPDYKPTPGSPGLAERGHAG